MFKVSFSQASRLNSFFLLVSALLSLVQWFVWALYRVRFVLSFCLFILWWARLSEVVILSADDWVSIFVLFVVWMRCPAEGATVVGWCWVLYSSGLLCVSSHYLIPSRRRQWHPTPVLLPGKSHGWRSLVGCSPWDLKSRTWLSDFIFTFHFHALEKEMATHTSVLTWRIPGTGEPGGLPSTGLHRVEHDWSDLEAAAAAGLVQRSV